MRFLIKHLYSFIYTSGLQLAFSAQGKLVCPVQVSWLNRKHYILLNPLAFTFLLPSSFLSAQTQQYPVQAITEITPPYSVYLSDYTTPGTNKLGLNLLLTDQTESNRAVKLKLVIEGEGITISTSPAYMPQQIILDGDLPLRLDGSELAEYFNPHNLDFKGYSKEKFMQTGGLPEGIYRIGFQVFDYNRNSQISINGGTMAWLLLNDPPMINTPEKNIKLTASEPQNIMFQWMPRHQGSPNSAFNTEYTLQIYEIWPGGRNPNEVVNSTQPILEKTQTSTSYLYTNTQDISLEPGREYAFRVQARDVEGRDLFRNKGYSEVQIFTYGDACQAPTQIQAQAINQESIKINWQPGSGNSSFYVQYREANQAEAQWFPSNTNLNSVTIDKLKPGTTYEFQIRSTCGTVNSEYSETQTIATQVRRQTDFACGGTDATLSNTSRLPLTSLLPGDIITSGKFDVQVTRVIGGGNGRWSGEGFARIPFMDFEKVHVGFKNISINESRQVLSGPIVSVYNADSKLVKPSGDNNGEDVPSFEITGNTITFNTIIDNVVKGPAKGIYYIISSSGATTTLNWVPGLTNGKMTLVTPSDNTTSYATDGDHIVIKDENGNIRTIDKDGHITEEAAPNDFLVGFSPVDDQLFGFDQYDPAKTWSRDYYNKETIQGSESVISWKSVQQGCTDYAYVNIPPTLKDIKDLKITLETYETETPGTGIYIPLQPTSNELVKRITIPSQNESETVITATYQESGDSKELTVTGKMFVANYEAKNINVVLVPVNDSKLPTSTLELENYLNKAYNKACVNVKVSEYYTSIDFEGSFNATVPSVLGYNDDMNKLIGSLIMSGGYKDDPNTYYMFVINKAGYNGWMPYFKQFGFTVLNDQAGDYVSRSMAHELGHALGLKHTYQEGNIHPKVTDSRADNLMDDSQGTILYKYQWDIIQGRVKDVYPDINEKADVASNSQGDENITVKFIPRDDQKYGFDVYNPKYPVLDDLRYYQKERINGKEYHIPWKSIRANLFDDVNVNISADKLNGTAINVKITDELGKDFPMGPLSKDLVSKLTIGAAGFQNFQLTASYTDPNDEKKKLTAGKLNVVAYQEQYKEVVIVPVNENHLNMSVEELKESLNEIYKPACVNFTSVEQVDNLNYQFTTFNIDSRASQKYSPDMIALINLLKNRGNLDETKYYLFLLDKILGESDGVMPMGHFGFISSSEAKSKEYLASLIAHELGHGAFGLLHTFDKYLNNPTLDKNTTDNLMDYTNSTKLFKFQWDIINSQGDFPHGTEKDYFDKDELKISNDGEIISKDKSIPQNLITVTYSPLKNQVYGFDQPNPNYSWTEQYYQKEYVNGNLTLIPWKSVADNTEENVYMKIESQNSKNLETFIIDKDGFEAPFYSTLDNSIKRLPVRASVSYSNSYGYVLYSGLYKDIGNNEQLFDAGSLNVVPYEAKNINVVLVPINDTHLDVSTSQLEQSLNDIYKQACITVKVSDFNGSINFEGTFDTQLPSVVGYNNDMNKLIGSLITSGNYTDNTYYLFLLDKANYSGWMPFTRNFGFIFLNGRDTKSLEKTIAHELGHGAFGLKHLPKASDNLMDADNDGTRLFKFQWDITHNGEFSLDNSDEDPNGAASKKYPSLVLFKEKEGDTPLDYSELSHTNAPVNVPFLKEYDDEMINGKRYDIPWKSVIAGTIDQVRVYITLNNSKIEDWNVVDQKGKPMELTLNAKVTDNVWLMNVKIPAGEVGKKEVYTAIYTDPKNLAQLVVGKLNVITYVQKELDVEIVPVRKSKTSTNYMCISEDILEQDLNIIYKQACIKWKVNPGKPIDYKYDAITDIDSDLDNLMNLVKLEPDYDPNKYYIFLLDNPIPRDYAGINWCPGKFGAVFVDLNDNEDGLVYTVAHELGHGLGLEHPFDMYEGLNTGTINLMDKGTRLSKWQWKLLHEENSKTDYYKILP